MKKIILISGKARNGKDAASDIIKKELESKGEKVIIMHFAKYLKSYMTDYYGWDGIDKSEVYRNKLQFLGTEKIKQELGMWDFHVNRICEDIKIVEDDFDYILVPDARFFSEIDYAKAYFPRRVIDLRVERLNFKSDLNEKQLQHLSEIDLDDYNFSYYIKSESGIDKLKKEVLKFIKEAINE